jgi:hypothetical protein
MNNPQPWWLAMPPAEVAATILPCFSHQPLDEQEAVESIASWCKTGSYGKARFRRYGREPFEDPDFGNKTLRQIAKEIGRSRCSPSIDLPVVRRITR